MNDYRNRSKSPTVSHIMVFIILIIYIIVIFAGLSYIGLCVQKELYDVGSTVFIALFSYSGICGTSTIVMYVTKATKENELKILINKYKMKLELAKEIYRSINSKTLDDNSLALIKILSDDGPTTTSDINTLNPIQLPKIENSTDEGLG